MWYEWAFDPGSVLHFNMGHNWQTCRALIIVGPLLKYCDVAIFILLVIRKIIILRVDLAFS